MKNILSPVPYLSVVNLVFLLQYLPLDQFILEND